MKKVIVICFLFVLTACQSGQIEQLSQVLLETASQNRDPSSSEISLGLKEALKKGASQAVSGLSKQNGFLSNLAVKILFPPEFQKAEKTVRKIGLSRLCDQAITSFNRAAEKASGEALPILANAVTQMSFADAMNILTGPDNAATQYLIKTSRSQLFSAFHPVVAQSADQVHATKYWEQVAGRYNSIPFVKPVTSDVKGYITNKALDGLFLMIQGEEKKIRENPVARTTEILKRVFGWADQSKKGA